MSESLVHRAARLWVRIVEWLRNPENSKVTGVVVLVSLVVYLAFGLKGVLIYLALIALLLFWPEIRQRITKWWLLR